mmetsp:Transcript_31856/g.93198  ORF Transcript_31856/g.93198 Transcript_31856/m.93198 type:complete len:251 (+) Transcript_31856:705-1457(+)
MLKAHQSLRPRIRLLRVQERLRSLQSGGLSGERSAADRRLGCERHCGQLEPGALRRVRRCQSLHVESRRPAGPLLPATLGPHVPEPPLCCRGRAAILAGYVEDRLRSPGRGQAHCRPFRRRHRHLHSCGRGTEPCSAGGSVPLHRGARREGRRDPGEPDALPRRLHGATHTAAPANLGRMLPGRVLARAGRGQRCPRQLRRGLSEALQGVPHTAHGSVVRAIVGQHSLAPTECRRGFSEGRRRLDSGVVG